MPALAVAEELCALGHPRRSITFVGTSRGLESSLVPEAGFGLVLLPGQGVKRSLTPSNLTALAWLGWAVIKAFWLVGRTRPSVVLSVGGYASVPSALAALAWRVPVVVLEQNAVPGLANRLVGRFAKASAVAFEGTALPRAVLTGNPVRRSVLEGATKAKAAAKEALGLPPERRLVAAVGGSLGARRINQAVVGLARSWSHRGDLAIRHVVGTRDYKEVLDQVPAFSPEGLIYQPVEFERRMDLLWAAADVVLSRSGAGAVAELTALGVPSVLVPLPSAPGDHQGANARFLAERGAAVVLDDDRCDPEEVSKVLEELLGDPERLESMGRSAARLGRPDAAAQVAALVDRHARR